MKQFRKWITMVVAFGAPLTLAACNTAPVPNTSPDAMVMSLEEAPDETAEFSIATQTDAGTNALVRAIHLSPDAPAVDVFVDDALLTQGLSYTNFVGPAPVPFGTRNLKVKAANTTTTVIDANLELEAKRRYSVYAAGKLAQIAPLVLEDTRYKARNAAKLRVLHGAASAPRVDVYLSRPTTDLGKIDPILENIPFKSISSYFRLRPGGLRVRVTLPDTKTVVIDSGALEIKAGDVLTAVAIDKPNEAGKFSAILIDETKFNAPTTAPAPKSIVEIAAGNPAFSTLVSALQKTGLVDALKAAGPFTVFAPTNDAFAKLASLPEGDALKQVLLYHVASGKFLAADLIKAGEVTTLQGKKIKVEKKSNGDVILNGVVKVTTADIQASNGVIHVIDTVLIPPKPSIVEIAAADPRFTTLVGALQSQNLVGALSGDGPFTVFAPTNDAFAKLASLPGGDALTRVLKYHVLSGKFSASDLSKLKEVQTLAGEGIFITKQGDSLVLNGLVKVIIADIQASNGVIHVIDTVLLPDATVRAIHASFDAPAVDVLVNGKKAFENISFGTATAYATVPYGTQQVKVNVAGTSTTALQAVLWFSRNMDFTVIALNPVASIEALVLNDSADGNAKPGAGKSKLRLVHAASQAGTVDVYITAPTDSIDKIDPTIRNFMFKANTKYLEVNSGAYRVRITAPHSKTAVIDTGAVTLPSAGVFTGVALDPKPGTSTFGALLVQDR
jgi:uncharacterized surface protein with fasciclin (FAS1) repeats